MLSREKVSTPLDQLIDKEEREGPASLKVKLKSAISKLSNAEQRIVLEHYYFWEDYDYGKQPTISDIAARLDKEDEATRKELSRARKILSEDPTLQSARGNFYRS